MSYSFIKCFFAMKRVFYFLPLLLLLCAGGCDMLSGGSSAPEKIVLGDTTGTLEITGTVEYVQLEGGFWAIEGETGPGETQTYEPTNLPESFKVDGQRVRVRAKIREDMASIYQAGPIIEIRSIEPHD